MDDSTFEASLITMEEDIEYLMQFQKRKSRRNRRRNVNRLKNQIEVDLIESIGREDV